MEGPTLSKDEAFGLMIDKLEGKLSREGSDALRYWIAASPENKRIFTEFVELNQQFEEMLPGKQQRVRRRSAIITIILTLLLVCLLLIYYYW